MKVRLVFSLVFTLLLLLTAFRAKPDGVEDVGFSYIQNYTKAIYQAGNQNWSIVKDRSGVVYYGNSKGLLAYDGNSWQLYPMPNKLIVRSVAADNKSRVYVGGFGEFGYWSNNTEGKFSYTSLTAKLPVSERPNDEIWKIYVEDNRVIFQSFGSIFIYQDGKIKVVQASEPFLFLHKAGDRYFAEVLSKGLFELQGDSLLYVRNSQKLGHTGVLSVLPFKQDKFLVGTAKNGLFVFDGNDFTPWLNEASKFLKTYQLNNGALIGAHHFAFGTILNGIVILDENGKLVHKVNKSTGLQNNTVLNLYTEDGQNLWVGLDNGIDRIEINSPLYFYFDKTGAFGTVYSSIVHNGKIYLGTNQGLFYSSWSAGNAYLSHTLDFKIIEGSQGQVWDLSLMDGELLCGHNEGTFRVEGDRLEKISGVNGGWTIKKLQSDPGWLIQGTYTGLVFYRKDKNGQWAFSHKVQGFGEPSRNVEQDNLGNIWVSHAYKGLYKLNLSNDLKSVTATISYDSSHGLPGNYKLHISRLYNELVFSSESGFYVYEPLNNRFGPYRQLNKKLGSLASSKRIIRATDKSYWFIYEGKAALVNLGNPEKPVIHAHPFNILGGRMVQDYESISRISATNFLISIDDGFVIYNTAAKNLQSATRPSVLIRKVENTTDTIKLMSENGSQSRLAQLPYRQNNLRFVFALPYYRQAKVEFQFFLEGYSNQWAAWSNSTQKEFTNLAPGDYRFLVRARINDEATTGITAYNFSVLPPWYATWWAYLIYAVMAVLLALLLRKLYYKKLQQDKERIQQKLEEEKQEHLRQEALLNEQKIVKLRNEQLRAELAGKSRELASTALHIVCKNELLQNISNEVNTLQDANGNRLPAKKLRKIQSIITEGMSDQHDWDIFEHSFNEANENYFMKLKEGHPELTPNDLKLCAYLRMNMSSKEIASLLNITVKSVELRRYRLRKKLNMEHDKNLVEFFMEL
ncbi:triple tyrosine motif-containing protein [Pontibacter toksunensis]|uniref:Triple tyrosine motif-containing protein n=1 Tax=Pontibacter toksunensis TaxID=1332631 RepID=A0ABW6BS74_9BACT